MAVLTDNVLPLCSFRYAAVRIEDVLHRRALIEVLIGLGCLVADDYHCRPQQLS